MAVGLAIALFEVVETTVVGLDVWLHALGLGPTPEPSIASLGGWEIPLLFGIPVPVWLQPFYFVLGLVISTLAWRSWSRQARELPRVYPIGG